MSNPSEELSQKLKDFFDSKLTQLQEKFEKDIAHIEELKNSYFDHCIVEVREIEEEEKEAVHHRVGHERNLSSVFNNPISEKLKPKIQKEGEETRSKTPVRNAKTKLNNKADKTPRLDKSIEKTPTLEKSNEKSNTKQVHKTADRKKTITKPTTLAHTKEGFNRKMPIKKSLSSIPDKKKKTAEKHHTKENQGSDNKKEKPKEKESAAETTQPKTIEQEKISLADSINSVTIKAKLPEPKPLISIPEPAKTSKTVSALYLTSKGKFLSAKEKFILIKSIPSLYKSYNSKLSFLLDEKVSKLDKEIKEIEDTFSKYTDIDEILKTKFAPSKTALNSLTFVTKEEEANLIKKADLPQEIREIYKLIYIIIGEEINEELPTNSLIENLVKVVLPKYNAKDLKSLLINESHKVSSFTEEQYNKVEQITQSCPKCLSSIDVAKISRPISYLTFFLNDASKFLNLKTSDGVFYFQMREKGKKLEELKSLASKYRELISSHQ